jgi:uncharacterized membrane protein YcjF (UPF0283 family)
MKEFDNIIRDSFKKNMEKLEDDSFTGKIVETHLSRQRISISKPFLNFGSLLIGISSVIISIGLILLFKTNNVLVDNFEFKEQYGLILLLISLIFLVSNWIENFTANNKQA